MEAYQFAKIKDYSMSGSTRNPNPKTSGSILSEGFRDEGMASHVENPKEPEILLGSRTEINNAIKNYRENFKDSRGHKLRKDGKELLAGVVSWPPGSTKDYFLETLPVILIFLMKKYGKSLRCCLSHEDEPYLDETGKYHGQTNIHIHFFIVPQSHENFRDYHPGIYAKWEAKKNGLHHLVGDIHYKWRMGDWQEEFYQEAGLPLGWQKERPKELKEKRLSNREQRIIKDAKIKAIRIQEEAKIIKQDAEDILAEAEIIKKNAENKLDEANNKFEDARAIEEQNKLTKIEQDETAKSLEKRENAVNEEKKQAEIIKQSANKNIEDAKVKEKLNELTKLELDKRTKSLEERENAVKQQEYINESVKRTISEMRKNLNIVERLAEPIISTLNIENVNGIEKKEIYEIFFKEIVLFVKDIIKRIRDKSKKENKNNVISNKDKINTFDVHKIKT